ncbi:MAG: ABC transporter ATP-binding protein [Acidimicrobiia bacterium]
MSSDPPVITTHEISKKYRLGTRASYGRLTESLARLPAKLVNRAAKTPASDFWALRDITIDIARGEVVGIIGRNGAGKSTLLKILSRVTRPTSGRAELRGRVGALLEVGTGFHPELTGRENVFLSGAILGLSQRAITARFDEIVEFADIGPFLETPVKRYSSGMRVRLGFAVAAHLEPEILIIDEVLAVGDAAFQRKSLGKMSDASKGGRTILFVSHNLAAVKSVCTRSVLLEKGSVVRDGIPHEVVEEYLRRTGEMSFVSLADRLDRQGNGAMRFVGAWVEYRGTPSDFVVTGESAVIALAFETSAHVSNVDVTVGLFDTLGSGALFLGSEMAGASWSVVPTTGVFRCAIDKVGLLPGTYQATVMATLRGEPLDWVLNAFRVQVEEGDFFGTGRLPPNGYGPVVQDHEWTLGER